MPKNKKTERRFTPVLSMKHFTEKITEHNEKDVFMWADAPGTDCKMTYTEFSSMVKKQAAAFGSLGWKDKRIAILGETSPYWVATYVAAIASGNVAIPMDKELEISEIEGFLSFAEADAVVFSGAFNTKLENAVKNHDTVSLFIALNIGGCSFADSEKVMSYDALLERGEKAIEEGYVMPEPEDMQRMAVMLFTSGTTGTSKCVMLSEGNVVFALNAACGCVEFFPEDTIVSCLPVHHTYELCCLLAGMNYGMNIGINDSLRRVVRNFEKYKPTGLVLVPLFITTMNKKIWDNVKKQNKTKLINNAIKVTGGLRKIGIDLRPLVFKQIIAAFGGRLNRIVSGGAPLNPQLVKDFDSFGIQISEGYGITECSPLISVNPYFAPKPGSVGPAVEGCEVKIDAETVNDLGFEQGEILARGGNVMLGYYKNPEATAAVFTEDGYFRTGDVGYLDEDGYIFITGRKKSVIVLENGKNIFPEEIEEYLARLDCVGESVVVGRTKEGSDTVTLTAIVYPAPEYFAGESDINVIAEKVKAEINAMNRTLVGYKQIRAVEIRRTEFEKTTSKKIKRHLVK